MPGINRIPRGLLGLLGLKSLGGNPSTLLDQVQPNVNLLPFWLGCQPQLMASFAGVAASGFLAPLSCVVPEGKVWFVTGHSVRVDGIVGTGITVRAAIAYPIGGGAAAIPQWVSTNQFNWPTVGGASLCVSMDGLLSVANPLICGPGCQFGAFLGVSALAGGETIFTSTAFFEFDL